MHRNLELCKTLKTTTEQFRLVLYGTWFRKNGWKRAFFRRPARIRLRFVFGWFAEKRLFSPGGIPALICVDPDDETGGYYSDNTPAAAVGNHASQTQELESR
jgi:hypothetical protein